MWSKGKAARAIPACAFMLAALVGQAMAPSSAVAGASPAVAAQSARAASAAPVSGPPHSAARRLSLQQQFLQSESDASGTPRPDLYQQGIADQQRMASSSPTLKRSSLITHAGITGVQWTQIGPQPLRIDANQNFQGAGPDSGEVVDIAVDPSGGSDSILYIATNDGGIWKSTDGGTSWKPKTDYMPSLSMGAVVVDPTTTSTVYAGTGNNFDGGGVFSKGVGVYKSLNGGDTWTVLNPGGIFTNVAIIRMVMPASGTLLVATASGLFKSVDGGANFGSNSPSFNNGASVLSGTITDLHLDTATSSTVYAARNGAGLMRSTDSGSTFPTNIFDTNIPGHSFFTFAQSTAPDGKTIYANLQTGGTPPAQIWRTVNADSATPAWTQDTAGSNTSNAAGQGPCQCGYDQTIGVDPATNQTIYIGYMKLFASTDGGANFSAVSDNKIHWDEHALTFSPHAGSPRRVYVGNDGGIAASSDNGANWANLNEGIATNLFLSIDIGRGSTTNRQYSYGGTQDTGIIDHRPGDTGNDWHLGIDGDGGSTVVSRQDPTVTYSTDDGCFARTTNSGNNWSTFKAAATGLPVCAFNSDSQLGLFAVDPNSQDNLFGANGAQLFRSTNAKTATPPTFTKIDNGFPASITAFGTIASNSNILWVGLSDGSIRQTTNALAATPTWNTITVTGKPAGAAIGGLVIDETDPATAVVTYEGFNGTGPGAGVADKRVFRTTDTGGSWTDISGTDGIPGDILPNLPTHTVVIDPGSTPHAIIIANDAGVLRTVDNGASWQILGVGLPTVRGSQLQIDTSATPSLLRLGTYGRSVFELTPASGPLLTVSGNLNFGNVGVGHTATKVIRLSNVGSSDLTVNNITRTSGSSDFTVTGTFPATIAAGAFLDVTFNFAPGAIGPETAAFNISSNDQFQPNFPLAATGTGAKNMTTTVVSSSINPSVFGQPVTFTATVSDVAGAGTVAPTGSVTFFEGTTNLGSATLDGANPGHAVLLPAITSFSVGDHFIHAVYGGDGNFLGSTSADFDQTVNKAPTTTTVTSSGSPSDFGSSVTFTAHVTFAPPSTNPPVLPTGTVVFSVDGSAVANRTLDQPTGLASFSTPSLLPGMHTIKAAYQGDGNFLPSSGTVVQTVTCMHTITGSVPGALLLGAGSTCIINATVGGTVQAPVPGSGLFIGNSTIHGSVSSTGASIVGVCGSSIGGSLSIVNATGFVVVGDPGDDGCGGNTVLSGSVRLANNHGDVEVIGNILPSLLLSGTSGTGPFPDDVTAEIESNQFSGSVICSANTPAPTSDGHPNTVAGSRTGQCTSI
jgi:hypothetical protein